MLNSL
jgi:hypothetical protein